MATDKVVIRPAAEADLDDVARIERELFADPWSRRSFSELIDVAHVVFAVASTGERIVGYSVVLVASPDSELANLAVDRSQQGRGTGRDLLIAAMGAARQQGCNDMWLEVRESNRAARALYGSAGFSEIGRRPRYYAKPVEDAVVMRNKLGAEN